MNVDKLVDIEINEKNKGFVRHSQLSFTVNIVTFFTSKHFDLSKNNKGRQKLYDVNVRAIYGCTQVRSGHERFKKLCCYLNIPAPMLSDNNQNY